MAVLPPDPVFNFRHIDMGAVNCICFHKTDRLFCGTAKGAVYLWDLQVIGQNVHAKQSLGLLAVDVYFFFSLC